MNLNAINRGDSRIINWIGTNASHTWFYRYALPIKDCAQSYGFALQLALVHAYMYAVFFMYLAGWQRHLLHLQYSKHTYIPTYKRTRDLLLE